MKKLTSLVLCVILLLFLTLPALASETECTHIWDAGTVTTTATCSAAGVKTYTCTACGGTKTEAIAASDHTYGGWQMVSDTTHKRICTGCAAEETANHSWGEGQITIQPTCSSEGQKTYTCACGHTRVETVSASAHTWGEWSGDTVVHVRSCAVCGKEESGNHNWSQTGTVLLEPTCTEVGIMQYPCSGCDLVLLVEIPMLSAHVYDNVCDPDCNVCGATREAGHKFSEVWSKNSGGHWHACTACGEKKDEASHYPGPAATEEKDQICLTCGYVMTVRLNHTHNYGTQWTTDKTGHWYACSGCEEQKDFELHSYDDLCDPDCNVCGYRTETAHSYDEDWQSDESGHWSVCILCHKEGEAQPHVPGAEATEEEAQLCSVCGFELAPALEHVHEGGESWRMDEENHWKECACGEITEQAAHSWDAGTINEDTTVTYVCTECQAERVEGEPAAEDEFPWIIVLVLLLVAAASAVVALVFLLRAAGKSRKVRR